MNYGNKIVAKVTKLLVEGRQKMPNPISFPGRNNGHTERGRLMKNYAQKPSMLAHATRYGLVFLLIGTASLKLIDFFFYDNTLNLSLLASVFELIIAGLLLADIYAYCALNAATYMFGLFFIYAVGNAVAQQKCRCLGPISVSTWLIGGFDFLMACWLLYIKNYECHAYSEQAHAQPD